MSLYPQPHSIESVHTGAGASLLKTKNEDQGFEIIKEVPGSGMPRMGNPFQVGCSVVVDVL